MTNIKIKRLRGSIYRYRGMERVNQHNEQYQPLSRVEFRNFRILQWRSDYIFKKTQDTIEHAAWYSFKNSDKLGIWGGVGPPPPPEILTSGAKFNPVILGVNK
jgi:hypothetical protein